MKIETQEISFPLLKEKDVRLFVKRLDKVHPFISGNKWFKLKYNLIKAKELDHDTFLTFGGAYSNHISATAFAASKNGFKSIGIIRGEECLPLNPTLAFARKNGMKLHYVSRQDYRLKKSLKFLDNLKEKFGNFYLLPEGGTNELAIKGTLEVLNETDTQDYICCSVATGGTISGLINTSNDRQKVVGFPAIKGLYDLEKNIKNWTNKKNYTIINDYFVRGYGKVSEELIGFIYQFNSTQNIPLDAIYTGKMMLGIISLIKQDYFLKGSEILAIHTGGLQGNQGMNKRLGLSLPTESY